MPADTRSADVHAIHIARENSCLQHQDQLTGDDENSHYPNGSSESYEGNGPRCIKNARSCLGALR